MTEQEQTRDQHRTSPEDPPEAVSPAGTGARPVEMPATSEYRDPSATTDRPGATGNSDGDGSNSDGDQPGTTSDSDRPGHPPGS